MQVAEYGQELQLSLNMYGAGLSVKNLDFFLNPELAGILTRESRAEKWQIPADYFKNQKLNVCQILNENRAKMFNEIRNFHNLQIREVKNEIPLNFGFHYTNNSDGSITVDSLNLAKIRINNRKFKNLSNIQMSYIQILERALMNIIKMYSQSRADLDRLMRQIYQ